MDKFLSQLPFLSPEHSTLATDIASFVKQEIEPTAIEERDIDGRLREYVGTLAEASVLRYAVASPGVNLDVRALCLIREALSYSSPLADVAFVMQGLGTYAISQAATDHVLDFWLARADRKST